MGCDKLILILQTLALIPYVLSSQCEPGKPLQQEPGSSAYTYCQNGLKVSVVCPYGQFYNPITKSCKLLIKLKNHIMDNPQSNVSKQYLRHNHMYEYSRKTTTMPPIIQVSKTLRNTNKPYFTYSQLKSHQNSSIYPYSSAKSYSNSASTHRNSKLSKNKYRLYPKDSKTISKKSSRSEFNSDVPNYDTDYYATLYADLVKNQTKVKENSTETDHRSRLLKKFRDELKTDSDLIPITDLRDKAQEHNDMSSDLSSDSSKEELSEDQSNALHEILRNGGRIRPAPANSETPSGLDKDLQPEIIPHHLNSLTELFKTSDSEHKDLNSRLDSRSKSNSDILSDVAPKLQPIPIADLYPKSDVYTDYENSRINPRSDTLKDTQSVGIYKDKDLKPIPIADLYAKARSDLKTGSGLDSDPLKLLLPDARTDLHKYLLKYIKPHPSTDLHTYLGTYLRPKSNKKLNKMIANKHIDLLAGIYKDLSPYIEANKYKNKYKAQTSLHKKEGKYNTNHNVKEERNGLRKDLNTSYNSNAHKNQADVEYNHTVINNDLNAYLNSILLLETELEKDLENEIESDIEKKSDLNSDMRLIFDLETTSNLGGDVETQPIEQTYYDTEAETNFFRTFE